MIQNIDKIFLQKYGPWALVTGAGSGIGRELSRIIASKGLNLIIVGRRLSLLEELQTELTNQYKIKVKTLSIDLTDEKSIDLIKKEVSELEVGLLVPCAGMETTGEVIQTDLELNKKIIKLNIEAPFLLTHYFGKKMANRRRGGILFISSLFGYQGIPYVANYSATKAYILSLAEALNIELGAYGVDVTVSSPGLTNTEMPTKMPIDFSKLPMIAMSPKKVARISLDSLGKKQTVVTGFINKMYAWSNRIVPRSFPVRLFGTLIKRALREENNKIYFGN